MEPFNFRHFLAAEEEKDSLGDRLDRENLILFFRRGDDLFAATEEGRLVFAKMKTPDEETPPNWKDEAKFVGLNLLRWVLGQSSQSMFGYKDLPALQLLDRDDVIQKLLKHKKKHGKRK